VPDDISTSILVTVVDDDESVRDALKGLLQSVGFAAEIFSSAEELLGSDVLDRTSCLIVDVHMPVMTGLELQCRLGNRQLRIPMIFITARDDPPARAQAVKAGAIDFLQKPFAGDTLLGAIRAALHTKVDT
jgi:FixJ family two-component response regulator